MTLGPPASRLISVIGAGGLLGSAVRAKSGRYAQHQLSLSGLPWTEPREAVLAVEEQHRKILADATADRWSEWMVMWCGGGGSVAASPEAMETETELVDLIARSARRISHEFGLVTVLSFASSGGAIWSGSDERVLTERTPEQPWHPYGEAKLMQERLIAECVADSSRLRARLSRISNLYGPEPPGRMPRGLIGHLVANSLTRTPTGIYVPIDTQRDYIFAADAAEIMLRDAVTALSDKPGVCQVDLVAAGHSHTIASVAASLQRVLTRRVPLTVGFSPFAARQPRVLAFRSLRRNLARLNPTHLDVGLQRMVDARLGRPQCCSA